MAVSAIDTPVKVEISKNGAKGANGTNGTDGSGFNNVRKSLIDNPLCWLYKKNDLANTLNQLLNVNRGVTGNYTDIYGRAQVAAIDEPREEVDGWLLTSNETHTFGVINNIPDLNSPFSVVIRVGDYLEGVEEQAIISIPATSGNLLTIGSNSTGKIAATLQGSDNIQYEAGTVIDADSTDTRVIIVEYDAGVMNVYVNNALSGSVTIPTGITKDMSIDESVVTLNGDYTVNLQGVRFYDFILNSDEKTYIND
ncbi:MAG TPA: hypothetical protein EYN67_09830 [Flavobacteriales bacterium]|nr:hypothetical protein [Flavobacteriales bacterium]